MAEVGDVFDKGSLRGDDTGSNDGSDEDSNAGNDHLDTNDSESADQNQVGKNSKTWRGTNCYQFLTRTLMMMSQFLDLLRNFPCQMSQPPIG